ncbi:SDR family NAD(P)-dependent oxidoreductase [Mucilaginibacter limnophilus]|uniref:SDR family NAD(P)-dependent oxidoreductase n=1 Tax=Mucilaginibacter limnophilus TaxID=1932778 RepID=A0A3S2VAK4_9SPHI|nr:SDR family NAD(P)-dependent oxidoreductase [Mucilaginibacter limnophilus]RVU02880.1 SDR family NAD(P)-dependent oxidoreductase [Mucilaginibacter limnophilus]
MNLSNNKILITGGASGIGLGLTERFIKGGNTVIICGRRQDVLDEAAAKFPGVITRQCDLSVESERIDLYNWIAQNHSDLNVLVNNAGVQNWMTVNDTAFFEKAKQEAEINILAPLHLTQLFVQLKSLTTIMNVTSGLAFVPFSKVGVYSATKAFFRSFTLSLRHQLKDSGVEVIEIIPPALNTDLGGKGLHNAAPPVSDFIESIFEQLKNGSNELTFGTSAERAEANNSTIAEYFSKLNPS